MKHFILSGFITLIFLTLASSAHAAITLVQGTSSQENHISNSISLTFPTSTTSGNMIVAAASVFTGGVPLLSIGDNKGNNFTFVTSTKTAAGAYVYFYYAKNITGGSSHTVTASDTDNPSYISFAIYEYSGVATSSSLDKVNINSDPASATGLTGSVTTIVPGELYFAVATEDSGTTFSAGGGFSKLDDISTGQDLHTEQRIVLTATTTQGVFNWGVSTGWVALIASFQPASVDTIPPFVAITAPMRDQIVSSTVVVSASSTDDVAMGSVSFHEGAVEISFASSTLIGSTSTASGSIYSIPWNTAGLFNGSTTLWASGADAAGNIAIASTTVGVRNPLILSAPSVVTATSTATITWTSTNYVGTSQVNYGATAGYGSSVATSTLTTNHSLVLSGLTASTTYHYSIFSADTQGAVASSSDSTFTTVPLVVGATLIQTATTECLSGDCSVAVSSTKAGDLLVVSVVLRDDNAHPIASVIDNQSSLYSTAWVVNGISNHYGTALFYASNIASGITAITVQPATTTLGSSIIVSEYSGIVGIDPYDTGSDPTNLIFGGSPFSSGNIMTNYPADLLIGYALNFSGGNPNFSGTNGWTTVGEQGNALGFYLGIQQKIISATGTFANTGTSALLVNFPGIAAFKEADPIPPTVSWISPALNSTVASTVTLIASSSDNIAVTNVAFYQGAAGSDFSASTFIASTSIATGNAYSIFWNAADVPDGPMTLWAVSMDAAHNISQASITVNVRNTQPQAIATSFGSHVASLIIASSSPSSTASVLGGSPDTLLTIINQIRALSLKMFFTSNNGRILNLGARGSDVWALQTYLIMNNSLHPNDPTGNELRVPTGYFGKLTQAALGELQAGAGISPSIGIMGPKTYSYLKTAQ
jgi:hypothetical protein